MSMPLYYKDKRDELNEILWHFNVPKSLYNRLLDLRKYIIYEIEVHCEEDAKKITKALELIEEIMPKIREREELEII